jgi:hypothetical protein
MIVEKKNGNSHSKQHLRNSTNFEFEYRGNNKAPSLKSSFGLIHRDPNANDDNYNAIGFDTKNQLAAAFPLNEAPLA